MQTPQRPVLLEGALNLGIEVLILASEIRTYLGLTRHAVLSFVRRVACRRALVRILAHLPTIFHSVNYLPITLCCKQIPMV